MHKIMDEIFSFFPCELDVPEEVLLCSEEIRIRLRTSYFNKIFK